MDAWPKLEASEAWANCPPDVRDLLLAAHEGKELTFEQGLLLATAFEPAALVSLIAAAGALRHETVGDTITYVVNRNINFTNVCFVGCSLLAVSRGGPGRQSDALSPHSPNILYKKREKSGTAAPPRSASRADCRAISTAFSIATFCAPSSTRFRRCMFTRFRRWKSLTASIKPECHYAITCKC